MFNHEYFYSPEFHTPTFCTSPKTATVSPIQPQHSPGNLPPLCADLFSPNTRSPHTMDPRNSPLANDIDRLRISKEQIDPLREHFQDAALNYKRAREKLLRFAKEVQRTKDDLQHTIEQVALVGNEAFDNAKSQMDTLAPQLDLSLIGMEQEANQCSRVEDQMANVLFKISEFENQICPALDNHVQHIQQPEDWSLRRRQHLSEEATARVPAQIPPIVEEYYARIGDYRLYIEALHNFESELRDELDQRDFMIAGGYNVISELDFFRDRREEREQMQRDLDKAEADIVRLKEECLRNGYKLEDDIYLPVSEASEKSVTLTPSHEKAFDNQNPNPASSKDSIVSSKDSIIDRFFDGRDRITDWVAQGSPEAGPQPTPLTLFPLEDKGKDVDIDSLSEASWVDARHPSSDIVSRVHSLPPAFKPRGTPSPKPNALLQKSFESVSPVHQVLRQRSRSI